MRGKSEQCIALICESKLLCRAALHQTWHCAVERDATHHSTIAHDSKQQPMMVQYGRHDSACHYNTYHTVQYVCGVCSDLYYRAVQCRTCYVTHTTHCNIMQV